MINIEMILEILRNHNISEEKLKEVRKSYILADEIHKHQTRESGEPYIIHPLNVAMNLLKMKVFDPDAISAALLHDTIEDAEEDKNFSKEDIAKIINPTVAELVDGVTKMKRMNFSSKSDQINANIRKIVTGLTKDVRIILIKLADRLHNMETLQYKKNPQKRFDNACETMELFVPLSLSIGAYSTKNELEDLALKYIDPSEFERITEQKRILQDQAKDYFEEIEEEIASILNNKSIPHSIIFRTQTINSIYKKIKKGYKMEDIYDLFYLKVLVNEIDECFRVLGYVHHAYSPINGRDKDYIWRPKGFYRSLHTTVSDNVDNIFKVKIRTYDLNEVDAYGIPAYWYIKDGKTQEETQEMIRDYQFAQKLMEIDETSADDSDFIKKLRKEILGEHVYVYDYNGKTIELPSDSTVLEYLYHVAPDLIDKGPTFLVNGKEVSYNYKLENDDRIQVRINGKIVKPKDTLGTKSAYQKSKQINGQNSFYPI